MPTEVVKIVDPDNGSGTHYTSLSAWEAGEQKNLVTADEIAVAKCRSTNGSADTTAVTIAGWTTSSSCYIKIWTDPSDTGGDGRNGSYRHLGKWPSTGKIYRLNVGSSTSGIAAANSSTLHWRVYGLAIRSASAAGQTNGPVLLDSSNDTFHGGYLYLETTSTGSSFRSHSYGTQYLFNTILTGSTYYAHGVNSGVYVSYWGTVYCYNVTAVRNGHTAFNKAYGTLYCYNCIGEKNTSSSANAFIDIAGGDYNISNDSSAPGSNSIQNTTLTYVDRSNKDFHLASTDTAAIDAGQYDPSSGLYSDDIDGQSRGTSNWDIGADEYVSAEITAFQNDAFQNDAFQIEYTPESTVTLQIDALLAKAGLTAGASLDSLLAKAIPVTVSIDALLSSIGYAVQTLDALLSSSSMAKQAGMDSLLQHIDSRAASLDAIVYRAGARQAQIDALLSALGVTTSHSIDALLRASLGRQVSIDAIISAVASRAISIDSLLTRSGVIATVSCDALLAKARQAATVIDALLRATDQKPVSLDAVLEAQGATVFWTIIDALLMRSAAQSLAADAMLLKQRVIGAAADALVEKIYSTTAPIDAIISSTRTAVTGADGLLSSSRGTVNYLDALLLRIASMRYVSIDALLSSGRVSLATVDAIVYQELSRRIDIDALLSGEVGGSTLLDAILYSALATVYAKYRFRAPATRPSLAAAEPKPVFRASRRRVFSA